jgi:hypothetical protein
MKPTTRYPSLDTGAQRPKGDPLYAGNHEEHPCTSTREPDTAVLLSCTRSPRCQNARNTLRTGAEQEHYSARFPDIFYPDPRATKCRRRLPADPPGLPTYQMLYRLPMSETPQLSGVREVYPGAVPVQGCRASPQHKEPGDSDSLSVIFEMVRNREERLSRDLPSKTCRPFHWLNLRDR